MKASWRRIGALLRKNARAGGGVAEPTPGFIRIYDDDVTEVKEGKEGKGEGKEGKEGG